MALPCACPKAPISSCNIISIPLASPRRKNRGSVFISPSRRPNAASRAHPDAAGLFPSSPIWTSPPGEKDFVIRDSYTLPVAVDIVNVGAHAHYLGKKMKMTATLPGGEVKTLLLINDWDFAWQDCRYYFKELATLPQGTRIDTEIHWDNSAENERNPANPPVRVTWGEESKDEMGSITLVVVPHQQSDYATIRSELATRKRELAPLQNAGSDPALARKVAQLLSE